MDKSKQKGGDPNQLGSGYTYRAGAAMKQRHRALHNPTGKGMSKEQKDKSAMDRIAKPKKD